MVLLILLGREIVVDLGFVEEGNGRWDGGSGPLMFFFFFY